MTKVRIESGVVTPEQVKAVQKAYKQLLKLQEVLYSNSTTIQKNEQYVSVHCDNTNGRKYVRITWDNPKPTEHEHFSTISIDDCRKGAKDE